MNEPTQKIKTVFFNGKTYQVTDAYLNSTFQELLSGQLPAELSGTKTYWVPNSDYQTIIDRIAQSNVIKLRAVIFSLTEISQISDPEVGDVVLCFNSESGQFDEYIYTWNLDKTLKSWQSLGHFNPDIDLSNIPDLDNVIAALNSIKIKNDNTLVIPKFKRQDVLSNNDGKFVSRGQIVIDSSISI